MDDFEYYNSLNIYSKFSCGDFLNKVWINRYCCYPSLIDLSPKLLKFCLTVLGETITFGIVNRTISKVFTGGESLKSLEAQIISLNK